MERVGSDDIGQKFKKLTERYPFLQDGGFLEEHPEFWRVLGFLYPISLDPEINGYGKIFKETGAKTIEKYIELIRKEDPKAIALYQATRNILSSKDLYHRISRILPI